MCTDPPDHPCSDRSLRGWRAVDRCSRGHRPRGSIHLHSQRQPHRDLQRDRRQCLYWAEHLLLPQSAAARATGQRRRQPLADDLHDFARTVGVRVRSRSGDLQEGRLTRYGHRRCLRHVDRDCAPMDQGRAPLPSGPPRSGDIPGHRPARCGAAAGAHAPRQSPPVAPRTLVTEQLT